MMEPGWLRLDEAARHGLGDEIGSAHVEAHDGVEVVDGDVEQRLWAVGAGIVDEDVERVGAAAMARCMAARSVTSSTSVSAFWPRARIAAAAASISDCGAGCQGDVRAGIGQRTGGGEADAAAGAGDEGTLAVEAEGGGRGKLGHRLAPLGFWRSCGIISE